MIDEVLKDIKRFLSDMKRELPEVFVDSRTSSRREKAGDIICERVKYWGRLTGAKYGRISVKDQKTLWGSCSRKKNLNFNWRLAIAPSDILDYVVVHELAHLLEMNHSKKFWALVAGWCPEYKARRRWLRKHSSELRKKRAPAFSLTEPCGR